MKNNFEIKSEALFQIISMIISIFAFAFIIGGMTILITPKADAVSFVSQGCCLEAQDGSICQMMNTADQANCKSSLVATDCNLVNNCKIGCCYDQQSGVCSLNSPQSKCTTDGGNWTNDALCTRSECTLGCCVLGDQASITTTRECSALSTSFNFAKDFVSLGSDGTCNYISNLNAKGACTTLATDYSGNYDCTFTTKDNCLNNVKGNFYENYLCTAKALNTTCSPSTNTTCLTNVDQVYYTDTCGNQANIYDAKKYSNQTYWEQVIPSSSSCSPSSADCGNCDYTNGNQCYAYRAGKDTKPTYGNNVCRDLNCLNGRKHGESWCISDYSSSAFGTSPVGSRFFRGICLDGEISIEPCADFNQERCVEDVGTLNSSSGTSSFTESKCVVNQWRSCEAANDKSTYPEVKAECANYPDDCFMFLDNLYNSSGNSSALGLAGFKKEVNNVFQGNAGDIGKDMNTALAQCLPKYTPGTVFWTTTDNSTSSTNNYGLSYGGSYSETSAICSLGSFTCVSHKQKKPANTGSWKDKENPECNFYAEDTSNLQTWVDNLNERCRMLGPCGGYVNIAGSLGGNNLSTFSVLKINAKGKENIVSSSGYNLSDSYVASLGEKPEIIKEGSLTTLTAAVIAALTGRVITGKVTSNVSSGTASADASSSSTQAQSQISSYQSSSSSTGTTATSIAGLASTAAFMGASSSVGTTTTAIGPGTIASLNGAGPAYTAATTTGVALTTVGAAAIGAVAGYYLGVLIAKSSGMTPGQTTAFTGAMAGVGAAAGVATYAAFSTNLNLVGSWASVGWLGVFGWAVIAAAIAYAIYSYFFTGEDNEYYIVKYTCAPWSAPKEGDCSLCNNDIRTCSEYRCRSLGNNCHYYTDNGEPGWCATLDDTWSAKITPWPDVLTSGDKYTKVTSTGFQIEGTDEEQVAAWTNLEFGIITDKPSNCKLDVNHTSSYDDMKYNFVIDSNSSCNGQSGCSNTNQGLYHSIVLNSFVNINSNSSSYSLDAPLIEGDNNYYIRCKNFAGASNAAEFAVKIKVKSGPDLTPPIITRFVPVNNSYLEKGTNSTLINFYVNEPSECKYSIGLNSQYESMPQNASCITDPNLGYMGEWACYANLDNLYSGINKFYFECEDQPDMANRTSSLRNINRVSTEYDLNVCSMGLNITSLTPQNQIISGNSPVSVTLKATTSGCIDSGKSVCYYSFNDPNYTTGEIAFMNTNSNTHSQTFSNLAAGNHDITVRCEDDAGNSANATSNIDVILDNTAPSILRSYVLNKQLTVTTNEYSACKYTNNGTLGCSFNYDTDNSTAMSTSDGLIHTAAWLINQDYYIRCRDLYNNTNNFCGIIVRAY